MIIVIGGTKGGTGKSTLITNLAAIDVNNGKECLIVDADRQGSSSTWTTVREEDAELKRISSVQKFGVSLTKELRVLAGKFENIYVDAGGFDSEELRASLLAADRLYIPIRPAQFDLWSMPRITAIVNQSLMYNESLKFYFVINGAHTNPAVKDVEDVKEASIAIPEVVYCNSIVRYRRAFSKAPVSGMAVTELKGADRDQKAVDEITSFYKEIFNG